MLFKTFSTAVFIALLTILTSAAALAQQAEAPLPENSMSVRIGVVLPKVNFFEEGVSSAEMAASIRKIIGERFGKAKIEAIALDARLPQAVAAEAREKSCFYILQITVSRKRSGAKIGALTQPRNLNGSAQIVFYTAENLASATKAKDEFAFEYNLISTDDDSVKAKDSFKIKANGNGEDVLSPAIEKMMPNVLAAAK